MSDAALAPLSSVLRARGQVELFRWMAKRGLNEVNDTCVHGMTPLFLVNDYVGAEKVRAVLAAGGSVRSRKVDG